MASRSRVLYIGITNSIVRRNAQHKEQAADSFTAIHRCTRLVWYEIYRSPTAAIAREKQLKSWTREKDRSHRTNQPRLPRPERRLVQTHRTSLP
jgi:putative endonuclease